MRGLPNRNEILNAIRLCWFLFGGMDHITQAIAFDVIASLDSPESFLAGLAPGA
jgi:hypothetical protein